MPKNCIPIGGASGSMNSQPCIETALGRCNGRYEISFGFSGIFDPERGTINYGGFFRAVEWLYTPVGRDPFIRGQISCVTEPRRSSDGSWIANARSTHPNRNGLEEFTFVKVSAPFSPILQRPDFIGLIYKDDDFCPLDNTCSCSGGDQQIDCAGAEGGICCISKASIDILCGRLN